MKGAGGLGWGGGAHAHAWTHAGTAILLPTRQPFNALRQQVPIHARSIRFYSPKIHRAPPPAPPRTEVSIRPSHTFPSSVTVVENTFVFN